MKKLSSLIFFSIFSILFSQNSSIGGITGLVFHHSALSTASESDTLENQTMNYHFVKDSIEFPYFKKINSKLNQMTLFFVSNKFGGNTKIVFAKAGSSLITNLGIFDVADTLKIESPQESSKIITYSKSDNGSIISPTIFLSKRNDKNLLIPEIVIFNHVLSSIEKQKIETYLAVKYGISINDISEKNYVSSSDDILWDSKKNKNFNSRITGIGRDDSFNLYQKQSKNSSDDTTKFSITNIKSLNIDNAASIEDGNFLIWGDNGQELVFKEADLISFHPNRDLKRVWKVQINNVGNNLIATNVYFKSPSLEQGDILKLKKYNNLDNYQSDTFSMIVGEKLNDSIYVFKNIAWDEDKDGADFFTYSIDDSQSRYNISIASTCDELTNGLVKINFPNNLLPISYTLTNQDNQEVIYENSQANTNSLIFNNLDAGDYKITFHKDGKDIIRTFDLDGSINQNVYDEYLWQNIPIELDLNYENYVYTLKTPAGEIKTSPPFFLNSLGDFQLNIQNKLGCNISKNISVLNSTDYAQREANSAFKVFKLYPNPTRDGNFTLKVELKSEKPIHVFVYNSLGILLREVSLPASDKFTIPMSIPPILGYYNVKVFIPGESKGVNLLVN